MLLCNPEIETNRLGVADVQVPVRLGWKSRHDSSTVLAAGDILTDYLADEVLGEIVPFFIVVHRFHLMRKKRDST